MLETVKKCYKCLKCYSKEMKIQLYSSLISKRIIEKIKVEEISDKTNCKLAKLSKKPFAVKCYNFEMSIMIIKD